MKENEFIKKLLRPELEKRGLYYFIKEAKSVRGIPDIVLCYNGLFVAMEVKRSAYEARKNIGRIALQKHTLRRINKSGGFGYIVHPENYMQILDDLDQRCAQEPSLPTSSL